MRRPWQPPSTLDEIDLAILATLAANARIAMKDLALTIGLSAPSTADRVRRLEDTGVIARYTVSLNPDLLALPIGVYIRIRPLPGKLPSVVEILAARPEITACDRVTGDDCLIAKAMLPSVEYLEQLIDALLPVATTTTSLVQSSPILQRIPDLAELAVRSSSPRNSAARKAAATDSRRPLKTTSIR